jgi:hypothetical protein
MVTVVAKVPGTFWILYLRGGMKIFQQIGRFDNGGQHEERVAHIHGGLLMQLQVVMELALEETSDSDDSWGTDGNDR